MLFEMGWQWLICFRCAAEVASEGFIEGHREQEHQSRRGEAMIDVLVGAY
jgi:hypothetical protein